MAAPVLFYALAACSAAVCLAGAADAWLEFKAERVAIAEQLWHGR